MAVKKPTQSNPAPTNPVPTDQASPVPPEATQFRILKRAQCPTISGKSDLTYNIACDPQRVIYLRVASNSGGGFFNQHWIALADILRLLKPNAPITAVQLAPLYRQRSANSPGFLVAVLKAEGLLQSVEGKQRVHRLGDPAVFQAQAAKLIASNVILPDELASSKANGGGKAKAESTPKASPASKAPTKSNAAKASSKAPSKDKPARR